MIQRKSKLVQDGANFRSIGGISPRNFFDTLNAFFAISSKIEFENAENFKNGIYDILFCGAMRAGILWKYEPEFHAYISHDLKQVSVKKRLFKLFEQFFLESASQVLIFTFYRGNIRYSLLVPSDMVLSDMTGDRRLTTYIFAMDESAYDDNVPAYEKRIEKIPPNIINAVTKNSGKFTASDICTITIQ